MEAFDPGAELRADALDAIDQWLPRHRPLIQSAFDAFRLTGCWPQLDTLARGLGNQGPGRARSEWDLAPLGLTQDLRDGTANLLVRGLAYLPEARPLLADLVAVLQLAVATWLDHSGTGTGAALESKSVACHLQFDDRRLHLVSQLLWAEPGLSGIRVGDQDWSWMLDEEILRYRAVDSVEKYLSDQAWAIWPDGPVSSVMYQAVHQRGLNAVTLSPPALALQAL